jgi:hypothetical protein
MFSEPYFVRNEETRRWILAVKLIEGRTNFLDAETGHQKLLRLSQDDPRRPGIGVRLPRSSSLPNTPSPCGRMLFISLNLSRLLNEELRLIGVVWNDFFFMLGATQ